MSMYHSVGKQRFTEPQLPIPACVNVWFPGILDIRKPIFDIKI